MTMTKTLIPINQTVISESIDRIHNITAVTYNGLVARENVCVMKPF